MKIATTLFSLIFIFSCSAMAGPIILKEGEAYTYEFESLPFLGVGSYWSSYYWEHSVELSWDVKPLKEEAQLQVSVFEDSISETPVIEHVWTSPALNGAFTLNDTLFGTVVWEDFQGALSFKVLSGSLMFNSFTLSIHDVIDSQHFNIHGINVTPSSVSVPEPGSIGLLIIFAMGLCINAAARHRNQY